MKQLENCNEKCGNWEQCKGVDLYNICSCLVYDLHERKIIYVSNGSEGFSIIEQLFNILRHNSTKTEEQKMQDMNIPKPCEFMGEYLKERLKDDLK